jgi:hypothetical protein
LRYAGVVALAAVYGSSCLTASHGATRAVSRSAEIALLRTAAKRARLFLQPGIEWRAEE